MALSRLGLLVLVSCAAGCASHPADSGEPAQAIESSDLVGEWETEPTPGQFGVTVVQYSFTADGRFECRAGFASVMKPMATAGSYELVGDQLRLTTPIKTSTATVHLEDGILVLKDSGGEIFKLARKQ